MTKLYIYFSLKEEERTHTLQSVAVCSLFFSNFRSHRVKSHVCHRRRRLRRREGGGVSSGTLFHSHTVCQWLHQKRNIYSFVSIRFNGQIATTTHAHKHTQEVFERIIQVFANHPESKQRENEKLTRLLVFDQQKKNDD